MSELVTIGEFTRAIQALSGQLSDLQTTTKEVLGEAKKTNGRVSNAERALAEHVVQIKNLEREVFGKKPTSPASIPASAAATASAAEDKPITRRDLAVAVAAIGLVLAAIKWLPALAAAGRAAQ